MPTPHHAQQHTYFGLEHTKSGSQVPNIAGFEKKLKDAHNNSVQIGCDTFPNELTRCNFEAKPIRKTVQKLSKM